MNPALVLDASVTVSAILDEAQSETARTILLHVAEQGAVVPALWHLEVGNTLLVAERRHLIDARRRRDALSQLSTLPIAVDAETVGCAWHATTDIAEKHRLTLYDAAYVELSRRRRLPLATFDSALQTAAKTLGIALTPA